MFGRDAAAVKKTQNMIYIKTLKKEIITGFSSKWRLYGLSWKGQPPYTLTYSYTLTHTYTNIHTCIDKHLHHCQFFLFCFVFILSIYSCFYPLLYSYFFFTTRTTKGTFRILADAFQGHLIPCVLTFKYLSKGLGRALGGLGGGGYIGY